MFRLDFSIFVGAMLISVCTASMFFSHLPVHEGKNLFIYFKHFILFIYSFIFVNISMPSCSYLTTAFVIFFSRGGIVHSFQRDGSVPSFRVFW